jgi:hypothetical protein
LQILRIFDLLSETILSYFCNAIHLKQWKQIKLIKIVLGMELIFQAQTIAK